MIRRQEIDTAADKDNKLDDTLLFLFAYNLSFYVLYLGSQTQEHSHATLASLYMASGVGSRFRQQ